MPHYHIVEATEAVKPVLGDYFVEPEKSGPIPFHLIKRFFKGTEVSEHMPAVSGFGNNPGVVLVNTYKLAYVRVGRSRKDGCCHTLCGDTERYEACLRPSPPITFPPSVCCSLVFSGFAITVTSISVEYVLPRT